MTSTYDSDTESGSDASERIDRRTFLGATGATASATLIAGCGSEADGDEDGGDGGAEGTATGGATTAGEETGSGSGPDSIKIAHLAPMENPLGIGSARSAGMAVERINADGGIADAEVELLTEDTRGQPSEAQTVVEGLIRDEEVDAFVGTFVSEVTQAVMDLIAEFGVPFIVTGSAAPSTITEFHGQDYERYRNTFRNGPVNTHFQAEAMSQYADYLSDRHGWNSFAFAADDAAWTEPYSERLVPALEEKGYEVPLAERLSTSTEQFQSTMDSIDDSGADAVLRFFAHIQGGQMAGLWHQLEYPFGIEGIHVLSMLPAYYELTEGAATYETTSQSGAAGVAPITENTIPFTEAYMDQFADAENPPSRPMYMGFNTYDAIHIYKEAVERGGTADYENDLDTIVDAMLQTDHTGVAGTVQFHGPDSDYPHDVRPERNQEGTITNYPVTQWQQADGEGTVECVYPETHRTADHQQPHWME